MLLTKTFGPSAEKPASSMLDDNCLNGSNKRVSMCIITFIFTKAFTTPLLNLQEVLSSFAENVYVVTGGVERIAFPQKSKKQINQVLYSPGKNVVSRLTKYILMQIQISILFVRHSKIIDICVFFMEFSPGLPLLTAKLLRKRALWALPSNIAGTGSNIYSKLHLYSQYLSFCVCDAIVVYSTRLIKEWNLEKFRSKILIAHEHFLDSEKFCGPTPNARGKKTVGFVGRLAVEKGVMNFVKAIPRVLKCQPDVDFLIVGDGELKNSIELFLKEQNLCGKVLLTGWVEKSQIPRIFSRLNLLVVPSHTEGLPNVVIEAMACGAPVLASPVGAVVDIIKDGETGFLLQSIDPLVIGNKIVELFDDPVSLQRVSQNAYRKVRENFSLESTVKIWQKVLRNFGPTRNHNLWA